MKATPESVKQHLQPNETIQLTLYCTINVGYISRPGILAATNYRLRLMGDHMFGKGLTWDFEYPDIVYIDTTSGAVTEVSPVPFIRKIVMNHKDEVIVFTYFSAPYKVDDLLNLLYSK